MIAKLILIILLTTTPLFVRDYIQEKNKKTFIDFFNAIGIKIINVHQTHGIYFDRYVICMNKNLTFLEFKSLENDLRNFINSNCFMTKSSGKYIIDINHTKPKKIQPSLLSQVNCYNVFSFVGERLLISVFYNLMIINIDPSFFIKTIKCYTTNTKIKENASFDEILNEIYKRAHHLQQIKNTESNINIFFVVDKPDKSIPFILKHGKALGIYLIIIGNQTMLNNYGNLTDYNFLTSTIGKCIQTDFINRNLPLYQVQSPNDAIIFNSFYSQRICIQ